MSMDNIKMLSGEELLNKGITKLEVTLPILGLKDISPDGSWLEQKQIQSAVETRKHLIEAQRIEKRGVLSHAVWHEKLRLAEVTQLTGSHWQFYGHTKDRKLYLRPEEALFLMEVNCLLLTYNEIIVSLQQAYSLLLRDEVCINKYKVYSYLSRLGYKVFPHVNLNKENAKSKNKTEENCEIVIDKTQNETENAVDINKKECNDNELQETETSINEERCEPMQVENDTTENKCKQYSDNEENKKSNDESFVNDANDKSNSVPEYIKDNQEIHMDAESIDVEEKEMESTSQNDNETGGCIFYTNIQNDKNPLTKFIELKLKKLKSRQLKAHHNTDIHTHFDNLPNLLENRVVTVNVPKEELIPKNIFLNNLSYVLNLDNISSKNVTSPGSESRTYSISDEVNGDHVRRVTNSTQNRSQNIVVPPLYQTFRQNSGFRQFQYWRPRPNLNYFHFNLFFQRPFMTNLNTPRFQFYPRTHIPMFPRYFTSPTQINVSNNLHSQNKEENTRKRKRDTARKHHLESIKKLAERLHNLVSTGNTQTQNIEALQRLIHTYNIRYRTKIRLTNQFDIINDETIIETIELDDDDEEEAKRRRIDNGSSLRDLHLKKIRQIACRLRQLEKENKASPRHRRALSGLIRTYNKSYNADIYTNETNEILDRQSVTLDSSSEPDCVIEDNPVMKPGKKLRNPFSILKRLSEKQMSATSPTTSRQNNNNEDANESNKIQISENKVLDSTSANSWFPDPNDFGRPEVLSHDNMNIRIIESKKEEYVFEFLKDNAVEFNNWVEAKIAFLESIEETNAIFQTEAMKVNNVEIKSIIKSEDCTDMPTVLKKLSIIKRNNTTSIDINLSVDFDVYNRNVQNFRKSNCPTPHFRIVCLNDISPFPSSTDIASLHSKYKDDVMIVFAIVGFSSISFIQMYPVDSPVYTSSNN
ncbi:unnamed protein product [Diatraea saccharalis]|uniref:tRNA-splicing endonuclease subunit Sen54 N-terminal domain-containing protein n=1 Tax=Diatraea saccharalis TaxID=40085 RepID=A0A9N9QYX7_9NEOP|nr:unnamed protein product [Diatraea saccharalis]